MKLSPRVVYYLVSLAVLTLLWGLFSFLEIEFSSIVFFILAYVWHFTLQTPGLKDMVMNRKGGMSFLSVIVRVNHYLQMMIHLKNFKFKPALVRMISPLLFCVLIILMGGAGNMLFVVAGSFTFEVLYFFMEKKLDIKELNPLVNKGDQETH